MKNPQGFSGEEASPGDAFSLCLPAPLPFKVDRPDLDDAHLMCWAVPMR